MQIIPGPPPFAPARCLVTKKGGDEKFIDLLMDFDLEDWGHMYIHHSAVRDMWNLVLDDPELADLYGRDQKDVRIDELEAEKALLEKKVAALEAFKESVYVIKSEGYKPQKKPGRKAKEPVTNGS